MGIRLSSYGAGKVTFDGLTPEQIELFQGMNNGVNWLTIRGGALDSVGRYGQPPAPEQDPLMPTGWGGISGQLSRPENVRIENFSKPPAWFSPNIVIQHLCAYSYTPEFYRRTARQLEDYGFDCCRSRRGVSGQYWELWLLPFLEASKGKLLEAIGERTIPLETRVENAVRFLCRNVCFGTLDVSYQRAAMCIY